MPKKAWIVDLTDLAEKDFADILNWTAENFGARQAGVYAGLLRAAVKALASDPFTRPSRKRDEIGKGSRTLHVARPGRHMLVYRLTAEDTVLVLRILHDSMELSRHLPPEEDG
ncbi:MAG TPA: type II toxin-antitoxin system RelE/ParE family toxin [Caulobacterales bacterium]|nr:type II toxin-antitoxin system RelE/ParE family toxin [Caulobacterales bacterium]